MLNSGLPWLSTLGECLIAINQYTERILLWSFPRCVSFLVVRKEEREKCFPHAHSNLHCSSIGFTPSLSVSPWGPYSGIRKWTHHHPEYFTFCLEAASKSCEQYTKNAFSPLTIWEWVPAVMSRSSEASVVVSCQQGRFPCTMSGHVRRAALRCYCCCRPYFSITRCPSDVLYRKKGSSPGAHVAFTIRVSVIFLHWEQFLISLCLTFTLLTLKNYRLGILQNVLLWVHLMFSCDEV